MGAELSSHRVAWSEGLFLQQQHFQQFDRHLDDRFMLCSRGSREWFWGFADLLLDMGACKLGKVGILSGRGKMPDGMDFCFSDIHRVPLPVDVPEDSRNELVYLVLPQSVAGRASFSYAAQGRDVARARFLISDISVEDVFNPQLNADIALAEENYRIVMSRDLEDGLVSLPLARVFQVNGDSMVEFDHSFIPPSLTCFFPPVREAQRDLLGLFRQRGGAISRSLAGDGLRGGSSAGVGSGGDIAEFLMLQTINRYLPFLEQQLERPNLAFSDFYFMCQQMAGDLQVFVPGLRLVESIVPYDHGFPELCLPALVQRLRDLLSLVVDQPAIRIELQERQLGVRVAIVNDVDLFRTAQFVIAIKADMPSETVRTRLPSQIKIGPVERIREFVNLHLPGVPVMGLPVAPQQIPFHAGFCYFELDQGSEFWRPLPRSGGLALHIAGDFPGMQVELWAIRDLKTMHESR